MNLTAGTRQSHGGPEQPLSTGKEFIDAILDNPNKVIKIRDGLPKIVDFADIPNSEHRLPSTQPASKVIDALLRRGWLSSERTAEFKEMMLERPLQAACTIGTLRSMIESSKVNQREVTEAYARADELHIQRVDFDPGIFQRFDPASAATLAAILKPIRHANYTETLFKQDQHQVQKWLTDEEKAQLLSLEPESRYPAARKIQRQIDEVVRFLAIDIEGYLAQLAKQLRQIEENPFNGNSRDRDPSLEVDSRKYLTVLDEVRAALTTMPRTSPMSLDERDQVREVMTQLQKVQSFCTSYNNKMEAGWREEEAWRQC